MARKKIIIGMSGGIDSCMALFLLKKQGYEPTGVTLKYSVWSSPRNKMRENVCCTQESLRTAQKVCEKYGVKHHILDKTKEFDQKVIAYFNRELKAGRTPNPCIVCNRQLKFKALLEVADQIGADYVATGHYAKKIEVKGGKWEMGVAKDKNKDQTYSLSFLTQGQLRRCLFPLGEYTKQEVHQLAKQEGLLELVTKKESQDFCFVSGRAIRDYLTQEIGTNPGDIVNANGEKMGTHQGLHFYTLGQKKNLQLPVPVPYYVVKKDRDTNTITVSPDPNDPLLFSKRAALDPANLINPTELPKQVQVRTRYHQKGAGAELRIMNQKSGEKLIIEFDQPQRAVTPGQYAVFYEKDVCLGGGRIVSNS